MLGAAKADALSAELNRLLGVAGSISVGADLQGAGLVSPAHEFGEVAGHSSLNGGHHAFVDIAGASVH